MQQSKSETLEFKEWSAEWDSSEAGKKKFYRTLAEYAVCFANQRGGTLVLGVKDRVQGYERAITGCGVYNLNEIRLRIYEMTDPKILVEVEELPIEELGVRLLLIHFPSGIGVHTTTDGGAKVRISTDCKPMTGSMRQQRLVETGQLDITAQTLDAPTQELVDPNEMARLRRLIEARNPHATLLKLRDSELMEQVGITQEGRLTLAGLLLMGTEGAIRQYVPFHSIEYLRMKSDSVGLDELIVLAALVRQRELSLPDAARLLQLNYERTRECLMQMVRNGLLERSGIRKGQVFRLSSSVYRELGESVAYIRERGIDALRHEELILSYVRQFGSISNRQVRELLGVDTFAASRMLKKLVDAGKLIRVGYGKKHATYVLRE